MIPKDDMHALHDDEPYCRYHRATTFAARCVGCREAILDGERRFPRDSEDKYHSSCAKIVEVRVMELLTC